MVYIFPAAEVIELIRKLSNVKSAGMDGLSGESLKYTNHILSVVLSICFACMFKHRYLTIGMLNLVIIPFAKPNNGDLSDRNKYRPIALSSTISKVFENVILNRQIFGHQTINLCINLVILLTYVYMR